MSASLTSPQSDVYCDLLIIGSGAGGLSAAVTAAHLGLKVIVLEKSPLLGGTTAWSGGWMWIPRNPLAQEAGIIEDIDKPLSYLRHELGDHFNEALILSFLENAPRMVAFFRSHTALRFIDGNAIPDFHGNTPDAGTGGRSVCAATFDGRLLGRHIRTLKPQLPETTLAGMGIASGDVRHFLDATHSIRAFSYVTRLVLRYWRDRLLYRRGMRLVNGNALVAALMKSALDKGVELHTNSPATQLLRAHGRVCGAKVTTPEGGQSTIHASHGVVLACGGFPHDTERKRALLPHAPTGHEHWSAAPRSNTGDGLRLGEVVGATVADDLEQAAALAPVSLVPRSDGSTIYFPHLIDRAKPGLIAVTAHGKRFANEADSYHDVMQALLRATPPGEPPRAWLICDHAFIRRYGLGAVKPAPIPLGSWVRKGYLKRGLTLNSLAQACHIDAATLQATVARYNDMARCGRDLDFKKGDVPYNRIQGDISAGHPNPCMAPLQQGPYYAIQIVMGSLGTFAGLKVNHNAQALDAAGQIIDGLYAAGNDMTSIMGGHYPSGGITLGPAMTFGFVAAQHAAGQAPQ
ncbi:FAD-dependent oxidoreductase [Alcaligenaceae bacterium CGII-47]|nr:FAD-dependent oxidoreductase [Alcaligenaceae bacterium CGII-47]